MKTNGHLMSTSFGQVLAQADLHTNTTTIVCVKTLRPLARLQSTNRNAILAAVRHIVSLTKLNVKLGKGKVELLGAFEVPTEMLQPTDRQRKPRKKTVEATQQFTAPIKPIPQVA